MGHPVRGRHRAFVRNGWFVCFGYTTALADLAGGKPARKVLVNSAQLAIALGAAGVVCLATGGHPVSPGDHPGGPPGPPGSGDVSLPAFAAAALAFFVVNNLLVEAVLVLGAPRGPALGRVRQGVGLGVGHAAGNGSGRATSPSVTCWPRSPTS